PRAWKALQPNRPPTTSRCGSIGQLRLFGRVTAPGLPRSEVPTPGRRIRSGRHAGCDIRPRIRRLADLSPTHPIRRRPCADPVQKQVSGEWMTRKGIDSSRPVTEARMSVAICGDRRPACRYAHAGYNLVPPAVAPPLLADG